MRLAIDAMGNDRGAPPIIRGVRDFLSQDSESTVVLVGDRDRLNRVMIDEGFGLSSRLELVHASQVMEMGDKVADLREKRDSSIMRLVGELAAGRVDAIVALGNTAAAVGAATIGLKMLPGVRRPGIAVALPTRDPGRPCVAIDLGANTASKPSHLAAYGVMASIYSEQVIGVPNPRVGLLNVGEEKGKGNEALREAFALLEVAPVNFIGNVEGRDIFNGHCDVIVCDGFIGNVVLKASEEIASMITSWIKEAFTASIFSKIGAKLFMRSAINLLRSRLDYATVGGAPLLGVNGVCLIGHGRSSPEAVASALRAARASVSMGINDKIKENIERLKAAGPLAASEKRSNEES